MRPLIVGNWKMHGLGKDLASLRDVARGLSQPGEEGADIVVCPPFTLLREANALHAGKFALGAQDCSAEMNGPFTGDISAEMVREAGADYVILGHSERRCMHGEDDVRVQRKIVAALRAGLIPIMCFGESQLQRARGEAVEAVIEQVQASVPPLEGRCIVAAYEPLWAIGSGLTPNRADITQAHKAIRMALAHKQSSKEIRVLYGGSVRPANSAELLSTDGVSGLLVGAASLETASFLDIIEHARNITRRDA